MAVSTETLSASRSRRPTPIFELTPKQVEANALLASPARHILLRGGARSGKTFLLMRAIVIRACSAPGSTHAVLRFRFNHLKQSIIGDTLPKVLKLCAPHVPMKLNKTDWVAEFPNGSKILFGGLDDKERTERILGQEHSTIYLNEASQISYGARNMAMTRLAQNSGLVLKEYADCNPPSRGHWTHTLYIAKQEPTGKQPLPNPEHYASLRLNPADNPHLPDDYLETLDALPERERRRFRDGEYGDEVSGALWTYESFDVARIQPNAVPPLRRVVVAVDPSGCSGPEDLRSDEIGIVVVGIDENRVGYVLEDCTGRFSPRGWAQASLRAFDRWKADVIVAERNFGGAMVESTIRSERSTASVKMVTASRGKMQRAEPIASLYEQGKVRHAGAFPELEAELLEFSTAGFTGSRSPDRSDAMIWGMSELMLGPSTAAEQRRVHGFV